MPKKSMGGNNAPRKVLVTGGGGFLGSAIVKLLVKRGDEVYSFSRNDHDLLRTLGVSQIKGDVRDNLALEKACRGMKLVFHVAAKVGVWGEYTDFFDINVRGTKNVISSCKTCGVEGLIFTSSPSVVFNNQDMAGVNESTPYPIRYHSHYPKTKAIAEKAVRNAAFEGLKTITLRPHLIWGPEDSHLVPRILKRSKRLKIVGHGNNLVDTVYIDNAAYAHILAANQLEKKPELSGNVYFISQDQPVRLWDMINDILKAGGLEPIKGSIPFKTAWFIGFILEGLYKLFSLSCEPPMTRFVANELARSHWFDIRAAKKDLGYEPLISTKQGLKRLATWLQTERNYGN